jgi:hypothetical protein
MQLYRTNAKISELLRSCQPPTAIRPNNPVESERDPRPGRYSVVGPFIKLPDSSSTDADDHDDWPLGDS